ncbi:MAG: helix-turn-helix domain-containing protein [Dermatophilaceae bacterium]
MVSRTERARATRRRVVAAAQGSFLLKGYGPTTIRGVAEDAQVSQETIYKSFGTKAALLKAVYDVVLAGDEAPVPLADRPEIQRVRAQSTAVGAARAYAELALKIDARVGALVLIASRSQGTDAELSQFVSTIEQERAAGTLGLTRHWGAAGFLRDDVTVERARDIVWMLVSPEILAMRRRQGWSDEEYVQWIVDTLAATALRPEAP